MDEKTQIQKVYMVMCGHCYISFPVYDVTQRKYLPKKLREFGWKKTSKYGWVCDACLERKDFK